MIFQKVLMIIEKYDICHYGFLVMLVISKDDKRGAWYFLLYIKNGWMQLH